MIGPRVILVESHLYLSSPVGSGDLITYRYFETVSCADQGRWSTFLNTLGSQLANSGLGTCRGMSTANDDTPTSDLLIELRNMDYGRPLVEECVRKNGLSMERPIVPQRWIDYRCDEYFADNWWSPERCDRGSEGDLWDGIYDYTQMYETLEHEFLAIGSSSCDGIDFGCRKEGEGLWAYYPVEDYFKRMAPTVAALRDVWRDGSLSV